MEFIEIEAQVRLYNYDSKIITGMQICGRGILFSHLYSALPRVYIIVTVYVYKS